MEDDIRSYTKSRREKYEDTDVSYYLLHKLRDYYEEKVKSDLITKTDQKDIRKEVISKILNDEDNEGRFSTHASREGSVVVGVQVRKTKDSDFSVNIKCKDKDIRLSDKPINYEYKNDDIDSNSIDEVSSKLVHDKKRYFYDDEKHSRRDKRLLQKTRNPSEIPEGFVAVALENRREFSTCCVSWNRKYWLLAYRVLEEFYNFLKEAVEEIEDVTLRRHAKGPALTLIVEQDGEDISIDIVPKLTLSDETLCVDDFGWPRLDTKKWLTKDDIKDVKYQPIYLVPKGDKYWKISFANCENAILREIDTNGTCRKACLRIMKEKLKCWQAKSKRLSGFSSYLLKTTLFWMCEILPDDEDWRKDELANRYLNFLQEFRKRLKDRYLPEYFNPKVNLLKNKKADCIEKLVEYLDDEISDYEDEE